VLKESDDGARGLHNKSPSAPRVMRSAAFCCIVSAQFYLGGWYSSNLC